MPLRLSADSPDFSERYETLIRKREQSLDEVVDRVRPIVEDVRRRGLDGLLEATRRFDGVELDATSARVSREEIEAAFGACPSDLVEALEFAATRIRSFHERQRPSDELFRDDAGLTLGWRWTPVDAAGLYAPGGLAAYPSAILMNAIPAKAAGVRRLAMATPPARLRDNPAILAAAKIAGVDEIWRIGGAQAIAALAYGAGPIKPCDVIVGPGNAYVAAAKKLVFGDVGIDSIAGPSEVFILADGSVPASWIAADLLAQAEHDAEAQSVLFTTDAAYADAVAIEVEKALSAGQAGPSARASWDVHGAIIIVAALADAAPLVDLAAPEHVQIAAVDAEVLAREIRHAGALFLGAYAPEALGDYLAGPNHVLPTGRRSRFASGLSTLTFLKRSTIISAEQTTDRGLFQQAARIADSEGLPAHARSLRLRNGHE